jgi:hypothetical protein
VSLCIFSIKGETLSLSIALSLVLRIVLRIGFYTVSTLTALVNA